MMRNLNAKPLLVALIGALVISGCAKPHATDDIASVPKPSLDMASASHTTSSGPVETNIQPVQPADIQVALDQIYFAYDQSTLSEQARDTLATNAALLQTVPKLKVRIEGHCDNRGSDEYNLVLGERRAQSVRAYLVSLGIAPERLVTISFGEEKPIEKTFTEMAWSKNRRAEFKMLN
jgi:peptidoglycan-associated lipoprotein